MVQDGAQALLSADDEDDFRHLGADLQAQAGRSHAIESRRAPILAAAACHQDASAAGRAHNEAALDQLGDDQHAAGIGHELGGVGEVFAVQNFAGGLEAGIDQQLALGISTGRKGGKHWGGKGDRSPRKDGSAIGFHFLLLVGSWPARGKRLGGHCRLYDRTVRGRCLRHPTRPPREGLRSDRTAGLQAASMAVPGARHSAAPIECRWPR